MSLSDLPPDILNNYILSLERTNYKSISNFQCVSKEFLKIGVFSNFIRSYFVKKRILRSMRQRFKRKRYQLLMKRSYRHPDTIPLWPPFNT